MAISNTITDIIPKILAKGLMTLRGTVLMTRLVNTDYSMEARRKGSTIDVPIPSAVAVSDVVPAAVPSEPGNIIAPTVAITLDKWKKAGFGLTDSELTKINANENFIPMEMNEAFSSLASQINQDVFAEYPGIYGFAGTAGTTPFGTDVEVVSATGLRKVLHSQRCLRDNRRAILDFDAEALALGLSAFSDAEKTGSADVKISGEIGRKFGFDWNTDEDVPTHTRGALGAGVLTVNGVNAKDATTLSIAKAAGASWDAVEGDLITIAGHSQQYVIAADVTVVHTDNTDVTISPGLEVATAGAEAITSIDTHVVNLGFHRDAFALAMRSPDLGLKEIFNDDYSYTMADPLTGLVIRLELIRMYKGVAWEIDCMYGCKLVRPPLAARLLG